MAAIKAAPNIASLTWAWSLTEGIKAALFYAWNVLKMYLYLTKRLEYQFPITLPWKKKYHPIDILAFLDLEYASNPFIFGIAMDIYIVCMSKKCKRLFIADRLLFSNIYSSRWAAEEIASENSQLSYRYLIRMINSLLNSWWEFYTTTNKHNSMGKQSFSNLMIHSFRHNFRHLVRCLAVSRIVYSEHSTAQASS